jgi:hypothetical protein
MTQASWVWQWLPDQGSGTEHFAYRATADGHELSGRIDAVLEDGRPVAASYLVAADAAWRTRLVRVEIAPQRVLEIRANGAGRWSDSAGTWIPALDGCIDVDITLTPATNTLPIRRLKLATGGAADISVAYVLAPELKLRAAPQRYTKLREDCWRFESLDSGFTADIAVDDQGFISDYPGLFRRAR